MLRVNTGIKPNAAGACVFGVAGGGDAEPLGALDGDLCGFPNGRRLHDDVIDIELRALVEGYGPILNAVFGVPNNTPNNLVGDGVNANDMPFLTRFPMSRPRTRATSTPTIRSAPRPPDPATPRRCRAPRSGARALSLCRPPESIPDAGARRRPSGCR